MLRAAFERVQAQLTEEGRQIGALQQKQEVLIMQMIMRFPLTEYEIQLIRDTHEAARLRDALIKVMVAQTKQEVLEILDGGPTLGKRLREQGMQKGALLGMQETLIMQVTTRFHLTENEIQLIRKTQEADKLNAALRKVVTAQSKQEILESLNGTAS